MKTRALVLLVCLANCSASDERTVVEYAGASAPETTVLAEFRGGEITAGEYRGWLDANLKEESADRLQSDLRSMALLEALAERSEENGREESRSVELAMLEFETSRLARLWRLRWSWENAVSEAEVDEALQADPSRLRLPRRVRLRNLFKRFPPQSDAASRGALRARMEEFRTALLQGADFGKLAEEESDSQTRFRQGLIGNVRPGQLERPIEDAAFALEPGEISPVLETEEGLTLLKCESILPEQERPLDKLRNTVRERMNKQRLEQEMERIRSEARQMLDVDLRAARLVSTPDGEIVVRLRPELELSASDLKELFRVRRMLREPADFGEEKLRTVLENFAAEVVCARRARELELERDASFQAALRWHRLSVLAREEVNSRGRELFTPPEEAEVRKFFEEHPERFKVEDSYHLAAIRLSTDATTLRDQYRQARLLEHEIRVGRLDFGDAAREHSELPSASEGGDLGWLTRKQVAGFGPNVLRTVRALEPGQISELVQQVESAFDSTISRLWILRLLETRPPRRQTFEEAREVILTHLSNQKRSLLHRQIESEVMDSLGFRPVEGPDR